jgi:hypothetical protein
MLSFLPHALRGVLIALLLGLHTVLWTTPLSVIATLKVVVPFVLKQGLIWVPVMGLAS